MGAIVAIIMVLDDNRCACVRVRDVNKEKGGIPGLELASRSKMTHGRRKKKKEKQERKEK